MEAKVLFKYNKEQDDELSLEVNEILTDVKIIEEGWCEGTLNGTRGMFPENFVEIRPKSEPEPPKLRTESADKKRRAKVAFSYTADNSDELTLPLGSIVEILGEEEEGWWRGKLNGKEGVFPSNFVELVEEEESSPPPYSNVTPNKQDKPRPPSMIAMPGLGGINPNELRQKLKPVTAPGPAGSEAPPPMTRPAPPSITKAAPPPAVSTAQEPQPQKAKVMFSYNADQDDEVSVVEGDVVDVIAMQTDQDGWWKVKAGGKVGFVPDNFLSLVSSSTTSNVTSKGPDSSTSMEPGDNPPLPPKSTAPPAVVPKPKPPSTSSVVKPPKSAVELPKLPSKQPELPKKEPVDLDVPRQDVLDNKLAKEKPKRTARPPSRNTSTADVSEEQETEPDKTDKTDKTIESPPSTRAPWQKELQKRKPRPTPPTVPGGSEPAKPPTTTAKPAPDVRPKPKPSKPTPTPKPAEPSPVPSTSPVTSTPPKPTPGRSPPMKEKHHAAAVTSPPDNAWKEAFEQLQEEFKTFQEKIRQEMQKEIDVLTKDLDEERKKIALMQIDIDRLKKAREYRDTL